MQNLDITTQTINEVVSLHDLAIPSLEKVVDKRGYMYLLIDSVFPDYIKIGRTSDPRKRLMSYNSDRPLDTCRYILITSAFVDVHKIEEVILQQLYLHISSSVKSKEWFEIKHKDLLIEWLHKAEEQGKLLK